MQVQNKYDEQRPSQYNFFMFVNIGSGGNQGSLLLQQQVQRIQFLLQSDDKFQQQISYRCNVFIYNMRVNKDQGFKRLKKQLDTKGNKCYAIVCGGDGTVMWMVTEMVKYDIKVMSVPIAVIPLGTGNDFSRQLGWGYQKSGLLQSGFKNLKKQIRNWLKAKQQYFDIWDIQAQVYPNGKFQKVDQSNNKLLEGKTYKRSFCNYFSFGIDGKIGYSFDMHRTKTRIGNLAMYACMGVVKTMTPTKSLDQLLDSIELQSNVEIDNKITMSTYSQNQNKNMRKSISLRSSTNSVQSNLSNFDKSSVFQKNYYNILVLNINSYTGGVKDIWQNAKTGFIKDRKIQQQYHQSSTGDGKLEIVSFGSSFGIALQRMIGGNAKKVAQGQGPYIFNFHEYENKSKHRTYLQIDGQFIRFTNPKRIVISHSQLVPKGKIKVLRNVKQDK